MLRVTIEVIPFGVESLKRAPRVIEIENDATGSERVGNYNWRSINDSSLYGEVLGFDRRRDHAELVAEVFGQIRDRYILKRLGVEHEPA